MVTQQAFGNPSRAGTELEDGSGSAKVGMGDQVGGRTVLVEPLRVLPPSYVIIERPRGRVAEGRLRRHHAISACLSTCRAASVPRLGSTGSSRAGAGTRKRNSAVAVPAPTSWAERSPARRSDGCR